MLSNHLIFNYVFIAALQQHHVCTLVVIVKMLFTCDILTLYSRKYYTLFMTEVCQIQTGVQ
jgi:hypothetical protein